MIDMLARHWWAFAIRGVVAIIFGILALIWPGTTFYVLTLLFGVFAMVDGILAFAAAVWRFERRQPGGWLLVEGAVGVIAGILAFIFTGIAALTLLYLIAIWAILTGALEIAAAVELRRALTNEWLLILGGAASVVFGALLFFFPEAGIVTVAWLVGVYAIIFGALEAGLAWRLRSVRRAIERGAPPMRLV